MAEVDNFRLIAFVMHLHEMHSDLYGFNINVRDPNEGADRCKRWMDAVLPPPPKHEGELSEFLKEAAE